MIEYMTQHRFGRIILHTVCALRNHKWAFHWPGIVREARA